MTVILVCGGRAYGDAHRLGQVLDEEKPTRVVHGSAPGADTLADMWAYYAHVPVSPYRIQRHKGENGYRRNQRMLDSEPDIEKVVAFPGGNGTADMVKRARAKGIPVREIL